MAKKTGLTKRALAWLCVVLMVVSLLSVSVFAEGEGETYSIATGETIENGTVKFTVNDKEVTEAAKGAEVTVVAVPEPGYKLTALTMNDQDILSEKKFTMPNSAAVVEATFTAKAYEVTPITWGYSDAHGGTVTVSEPRADEGDEITVTVTPGVGWGLAELGYEYTDSNTEEACQTVMETKAGTVKGSFEGTFEAPAANVGVDAVFRRLVNVTGTVTSTAEGASPIAGATVVLTWKEDGKTTHTATTGADGSFTIAGVVDYYEYDYTVTAPNYYGTSGTARAGVSSDDAAGTIALNASLAPKTNGTVTFDDTTVTEGVTIAYGDTTQKPASAGENDSRTVLYKSSNTDVATVDGTGAVTTTGVGDAIITAYCEESESYSYTEAAYTLHVTKAAQTALTWDEVEPTPIPWNETFTKTASGGTTEEAVVYESSDLNIATVGASGVVTPVKPGTVTISAYRPGNTLYEDTTKISYKLEITKANQELSFSQSNLDYTTGMGFVAPTLTITGTNNATGAVTYSSNNSNVATINSKDGAVSFTKTPGKVTITATKAEDDYYKAATQSYTINVNEWALDSRVTYYTIEGTQKDPSSGWYTDNVSLKAESGYKLSYSKDGEWKETLSDAIDRDAAGEQTVSFYVRDEATGAISGVQSVSAKKDAAAPTGTITHPQESVWEKLLHIFKNKNSSESFEITCTDNESGVKSIEYLIVSGTSFVESEGDFEKLTGWQEYTGAIETPANEYFVLYAKLTDNADNVTYMDTHGVVYDTTNPSGITLTPEEANSSGYYNKDVTVNVSASDTGETGYSGIQSITYTISAAGVENQTGTLFSFTADENTKQTDLVHSWNSTDEANASITVNAQKFNSDEVTVTVVVTDNAGNDNSSSVTLKINSTQPTVSASYGRDGLVRTEDGREYYDTARTMTVTIADRDTTFDQAAAEDAIKAAITTEKASETEAYSITWDDSVSGTHVATVVFAADAAYTVKSFTYTNKAGLANSVVTGLSSPFAFTVDGTAPTACEVTAKETKWTAIISKLTFGLFDAERIVVTPSAQDATSPFEYFYYKSNGTTALTETELKSITDEKWTEFESLTVDKDEQFTVYVKIMDYAGNASYVSTDGLIVDTTQLAQNGITISADREPHANGYYNDDVVFSAAVADSSLVGIKSIDYSIKSYNAAGDELASESGNLYTFAVTSPEADDLRLTWNSEDEDGKTFTVDAEKFNSDDVKVTVSVTDNLDRVTESAVYELSINSTAPTMNISYNNNDNYKVENERGYFPANRTATVTITDRASTFDKSYAEKILNDAISGSGTILNVSGENVHTAAAPAYTITWRTPDESGKTANGDGVKFVADIAFTVDANYTIDSKKLVYRSKASMTAFAVSAEGTVTPYCFTIDKVVPQGTITVENESEKWSFINELLKLLNFSRWTKSAVSVNSAVDDATAGIESVKYYKSNKAEIEDVEKINWTACEFDEDGKSLIATIDPDERFTVYLEITDNAGNKKYISSNGIVVDDTSPIFGDQDSPVISVTPLNVPSSGYYTGDAKIQVAVFDPIVNESYSGLKHVWYEVTSMGEETQSGDLYTFSPESEISWSDLRQTWNSTDNDGKYITVDSSLNNSNDVVVTVWAEDNAGKVSEASVNLKIDITAPTISVSYNNNTGDSSVGSSTYFNASRTATITITERNFTADNVVVTLTNSDGTIPSVDGWSSSTGSGNGDGFTHTATITYSADGDYTFDISFVDDAGLSNSGVDYGSSLAPTAFTIDTTAPVISVSYDNNEAKNENYYREARTATITIQEHNFETSRISVTMTATDDGKTIDAPSVSGWSTSGDTHTATVQYDADGLYTFDVDYSDMAGNQASDFAGDSFYVDLTDPALTISNISDESANNSRGKIGFVITATDTNFDVFTPTVKAVVRDGERFVTKTLELGKTENTKNGATYTVDNIEMDGIYRITCTATDKSGRSFTKVLLEKPNGTTYLADLTEADTLVTFSVNREGSTYELDENTMELVDTYYIQKVLNDVVLVEVNADSLKSYEVTLNGRTLAEGSDYSVETEGGGDQWYRYTYSINKDLFTEEGEYKLVVSSKDKAGSDAFSDVKGAEINFVVDRTAPLVAVTGMETNGRYQVERQTVTLIPTDDGGALNALVVWLVDDDGNMLRELINLSGEALTEALEAGDGKITFDIEEGLYQNIRIICTDCAVDLSGVNDVNTYDETFTNVSVSSSGFMIFWANKPLRYGTILGIVVLVGGLTAVLLSRRKKKKVGVR